MIKIPVLLSGFIAMTVFVIPVATGTVQQGNGDRLNSLWTQALKAFEQEQIEEAQLFVEQLVEAIPYEPSSRIFLARCQAKQNNLDGAIASLATAAELGWEDSETIKGYTEFKALGDQVLYQTLLATVEQNRQRPFVLYIGENVVRMRSAPLIVLYHGRGELPKTQLHFWKQAADHGGWVVLALKGTRNLGSAYAWERKDAEKTWQVDSAAIVAETQTRIEEVGKELKISKLVLAGFSQGGVAAIETLRRGLTPQPVGAVLFSTAFPEQPQALFGEEPEFPDCFISVHVGTNDRWLKGNQATVDLLKKKGLPVTFRVWEGIGHQLPTNYLQVILDSVDSVLQRENRRGTDGGH